MQSNQNITTNPGQVNHEMGGTPKVNSRIRTLKRKNRRLKATIRELRESLIEKEKILAHVVGEYAKKRDLAGKLMAVNKEIGDLAWEAEQKVYAAKDALLDSFLALSKVMTVIHRKEN